jgi:hypothetical protein
MTLAEDSSMSQPVTFDPNTTVGLFPWEDSTFGATRSYHLNSASVASSNPFTQMMAPAMDARSEMSVEAKVDKDDNTEQRSRMTDEEKEATASVGSHTKRAEGEDEESEIKNDLGNGAGKIAITIVGGFAVVAAAYWAISTA